MRLQLATWPEVEDYLTRSKAIIVPIGSTEQHGPTGLIGTDALTAEAVALKVGAALGVYVAPTLALGMAQHHLAFAGSITLRPSTLIALVGDLVASLARNGFERFCFINGHGGNIAPLKAAFGELYAARSLAALPGARDLRCTAANWWDARAAAKLARDLYGAADGQHATASEIAIVQHLHPDHIKSAPLEPPVAPGPGAFFDADDYRRRYPDGRIGSDPGLARPEHGAQLLDAAVTGLAELVGRFFAE